MKVMLMPSLFTGGTFC